MGHGAKLTPNLISANDFIFIFKMVQKGKQDDGNLLDLIEFKDSLSKLAAIGRYKLGGLKLEGEELK